MSKHHKKLIAITASALLLVNTSVQAEINKRFVCPKISSLSQKINTDNTITVKGMVFNLTDEFNRKNGLISLNFENKKEHYYLYITYMPGEEFQESLVKYDYRTGESIKSLSIYLADCKGI